MTEKMWDHIVDIASVVCIGVVVVVAIGRGVDGTLLFVGIGAIAGIAGYNIRQTSLK